MTSYKISTLVLILIFLFGCSPKIPKTTNNVCDVLATEKKWKKYAIQSKEKWGTPIHVQMSILNQESKFRHNAKPGRKKILGFIPGKRKSSAYGFAQVLDGTWKQYIKETGNKGADRDKFKDAVDFVGWYTNKTAKINKISKWDAENQYLAYHEGHGGFSRKTYKNKPWLIQVAKKVKKISLNYAAQFKSCS